MKMESKSSAGNEFNAIQFEKRLTGLKDSQESINTCCHWCLENRHHHKKIVNAWLNVLKRVKVEHRLTLFYLANDVIQYSKRKNYEFVESWGTTLQKATTMVRDERVKHKILRIFKIWEQRGIYNEEFISDLSGLISASPRRGDDTHEFQSSYLINKIRLCTKLENDTDLKLKKLKEHTLKFNFDSESLISSLKDRAHVDDVEKELEDNIKHMENYVNSLKSEIKIRINLISLLTQTETQLETDWKDVKLVANAYKTFGSRVKTVKKKLDDLLPTLSSPIPSPDVNAPSPSPDSDIELPNTESISNNGTETKPLTTSALPTGFNETTFSSSGYYNPVPPPSTENSNSFLNNGFNSSFIGSNMPFSLQNFNPASLFGSQTSGVQNTLASSTALTQTTNSYNINNNIPNLFPPLSQPPPPPEMVPQPANFQGSLTTENFTTTNSNFPLPDAVKFPPSTTDYITNTTTSFSANTFPASNISYPLPPTTNFSSTSTNFQYTSTHMPLMPPPLPPFNKSDTEFENSIGYSNSYSANTTNNYAETSFDQSTYSQQDYQQNQTYPTTGYDATDSFQTNNESSSIYSAPDGSNPYPPSDEYNPEEELDTWEPDASWMQLPNVETDTPESPPTFEKESYSEPTIEYHDNAENRNGVDVDHRVLPILQPQTVGIESHQRGKDVDHRNLISLTGSPSDSNTLQTTWGQKDQDYRNPVNSNIGDRDYRVPFSLEQLKLPPPPPPPPSKQLVTGANMRFGASPRKMQDNVESIDMELSDDEIRTEEPNKSDNLSDNLKVVIDPTSDSQMSGSLEPPPPFPELLEDVEANNLLDDLDNELNSGEFTDALNDDTTGNNAMMWNACPSPANVCPPNINVPPPNMNQSQMNWAVNKGFNQDFSNRGRGNVRGNFNKRSHRGANEFRGRGRGMGRPFIRGGPNFRVNRGGPPMRGGRGMMRPPLTDSSQRGGRGMRPPRGNFRGRFHNNNNNY